MSKTSIPWTATTNSDGSVTKGHTWNPIKSRLLNAIERPDPGDPRLKVLQKPWGYHCEKVSPGCKYCYAEAMNLRLLPSWGTGLEYTVPNRAKVEAYIDEQVLMAPFQWKKKSRVFPCSMTDWAGDFVADDMMERMLAVAELTHHEYLFLTKRTERLAKLVLDDYFFATFEGQTQHLYSQLYPHVDRDIIGLTLAVFEPPKNVRLGFSAENQEWFDRRWADMKPVAAAGWNIMCSLEPLLGPVVLPPDFLALGNQAWAIPGGESGGSGRPMDLAWPRAIIKQCIGAGLPVFYKQGGSSNACEHDSKGEHLECIPADLQVRQYPTYAQERK